MFVFRMKSLAAKLILITGIAIALVSLAFNLFGDALRDVLDARGGE